MELLSFQRYPDESRESSRTTGPSAHLPAAPTLHSTEAFSPQRIYAMVTALIAVGASFLSPVAAHAQAPSPLALPQTPWAPSGPLNEKSITPTFGFSLTKDPQAQIHQLVNNNALPAQKIIDRFVKNPDIKVVAFGENHSNLSIHPFRELVTNTLQSASLHGITYLALEIDRDRLDAYLSTKDMRKLPPLLASKSTVNLIEKALALGFTLVPIDVKDPSQSIQERDIFMADALAATFAKDPDARILVLVGAQHITAHPDIPSSINVLTSQNVLPPESIATLLEQNRETMAGPILTLSSTDIGSTKNARSPITVRNTSLPSAYGLFTSQSSLLGDLSYIQDGIEIRYRDFSGILIVNPPSGDPPSTQLNIKINRRPQVRNDAPPSQEKVVDS